MTVRMILRFIEKVLAWIFKFLPDCEQTTFDISRSLDRMPGFWKSFKTKLHLLTCKACRNYLKQLTFIRGVIRSSNNDDDREAPLCNLSVEAKERLKTAMLLAVG
jgi:hypothetical protein